MSIRRRSVDWLRVGAAALGILVLVLATGKGGLAQAILLGEHAAEWAQALMASAAIGVAIYNPIRRAYRLEREAAIARIESLSALAKHLMDCIDLMQYDVDAVAASTTGAVVPGISYRVNEQYWDNIARSIKSIDVLQISNSRVAKAVLDLREIDACIHGALSEHASTKNTAALKQSVVAQYERAKHAHNRIANWREWEPK